MVAVKRDDRRGHGCRATGIGPVADPLGVDNGAGTSGHSAPITLIGYAKSIYMFCHGLLGEVKAEIMHKGCITLHTTIVVASAFHQAHYSAR